MRVPSGARSPSAGAAAAPESSCSDFTMPQAIGSMMMLTGRAAAMEAVCNATRLPAISRIAATKPSPRPSEVATPNTASRSTA